MSEPHFVGGGQAASEAVGCSGGALHSGDPRPPEEQESCSCGATTSAESPGEHSGEGGSMGSCRVLFSAGWAQALSVAIPMGVYGQEEVPGEAKETGQEKALSCWMSFVEPTYTQTIGGSPQSYEKTGQPLRSSQFSSEYQRSEPDPQFLARRAEADAVVTESPKSRTASSASRPTRPSCSHDSTQSAAATEAGRAADGESASTSSKSQREFECVATTSSSKSPQLGTAERQQTSLLKRHEASAPQPVGAPKGRRRSGGTEASGATSPADRREEEAEAAGTAEEPAASAQSEAKPRTRGRRSIKRPARYEEWLADTSQEGDEQQNAFVSAAVASPGRQSQHKRGRGAAGGAPFAVPRGVRRREEFTEAPLPEPNMLPRGAARGAGVAAARRRRRMPWLDMAAIETSVACSKLQNPAYNNDCAVATGVAAAAAAAAAVAASAASVPSAAMGRGDAERPPASDGLQEILRRARDALQQEAETAEQHQRQQTRTRDTPAARGKQESPSREQAETETTKQKQEELISAIPAAEKQQDDSRTSRVSREQQQQQQQQQPPVMSAPQLPTLTQEFEEAAERAARDAAAFVASASQAGNSSTEQQVRVGPEMIRMFLLKHGRKAPVPTMRAPPQRAHQQLQMIQEQLLEHHRQHRLRQEQRAQQQHRSRLQHQQRHMEALAHQEQSEGELQLQMAQEKRSRQQQTRQKMESNNDSKADLELKLLRAARTAEQARIPPIRSASGPQGQKQQPASRETQQQRCMQRQHDRSIEQIQRLALLENIEALLSQQETPPNAVEERRQDTA